MLHGGQREKKDHLNHLKHFTFLLMTLVQETLKESILHYQMTIQIERDPVQGTKEGHLVVYHPLLRDQKGYGGECMYDDWHSLTGRPPSNPSQAAPLNLKNVKSKIKGLVEKDRMRKKGNNPTPQVAHKPLKINQMDNLMKAPNVSHFLKHQPPERDTKKQERSILDDQKELQALEAELEALKKINSNYKDFPPRAAQPHESFLEELERGQLSPGFVSDEERKAMAQSQPPPYASPKTTLRFQNPPKALPTQNNPTRANGTAQRQLEVSITDAPTMKIGNTAQGGVMPSPIVSKMNDTASSRNTSVDLGSKLRASRDMGVNASLEEDHDDNNASLLALSGGLQEFRETSLNILRRIKQANKERQQLEKQFLQGTGTQGEPRRRREWEVPHQGYSSSSGSEKPSRAVPMKLPPVDVDDLELSLSD